MSDWVVPEPPPAGRTHPSHCDYGMKYGGGRKGLCTCGLVAIEDATPGLIPDQYVRAAALCAAAAYASRQYSGVNSPREVLHLAAEFERYIRGDQ